MKEELGNLKEKIVSNIIGNVWDQFDRLTFYYSWSGLDLSLPLSIEERVNCLRDLISIYCSDCVHTVSEYADTKETVTRPRL